MRVPTSTTLRGLRRAIVASPIERAVTVLYLPSTARDRMAIRDRLARGGVAVSLAADLADALRMLTARAYDLVVVDLAGGEQAIATVRILHAQPSRVPVIGVMDPSDRATAVDAVCAGASDLLPWPFSDADVQDALSSARDRAASAADSDSWSGADEYLYLHSPAMRLAVEGIRAAISRKAGILFVGPTSSGRTLLARSRHALDDDYVNRPFLCVDCGTGSETDVERRLFGNNAPHASDAPDGVEVVNRNSALVSAQGGSLFLKNLTAAPSNVQTRLAALLRDGEVFSVDAHELIQVDVRVMAGVDANVEDAVGDGRLSQDLFDRIAGVRIDVPPFCSRREDLPFLAMRCLGRASEADRLGRKRFSRAALALMSALPWKGNGSEMADVVTAIVRSTRQSLVQIDDVLEHVNLRDSSEDKNTVGSLRDARERFEREHISAALVRNNGRVGDAARELGIQRTNLYRKVRQLKVSKTLLATGR
jgi:DNA-binding NtrC family response regulator